MVLKCFHKVSSVTWVVCLLKDLQCWQIPVGNRDGCNVDSWQPGSFCSTWFMSQFLFFPVSTAVENHLSDIHGMKAIISEREAVFLNETWVLSKADSSWLHFIAWCFTAVITVALWNIICSLMWRLRDKRSGLCAFLGLFELIVSCNGHLIFSTGFAGQGWLCSSASVSGHIWMEAYLCATNSCNQD